MTFSGFVIPPQHFGTGNVNEDHGIFFIRFGVPEPSVVSWEIFGGKFPERLESISGNFLRKFPTTTVLPNNRFLKAFPAPVGC
jgi:hypothetical protein